MKFRIGTRSFNRIRIIEPLFLDDLRWRVASVDTDDPEDWNVLHPCSLTLESIYVNDRPCYGLNHKYDFSPGFTYSVDNYPRENHPEFTAEDLIRLEKTFAIEVIE